MSCSVRRYCDVLQALIRIVETTEDPNHPQIYEVSRASFEAEEEGSSDG